MQGLRARPVKVALAGYGGGCKLYLLLLHEEVCLNQGPREPARVVGVIWEAAEVALNHNVY